MKKRISGVVMILVAVTLLMFYMEAPGTRSVGRFVIVEPVGNWSNFVWVLDSVTGEVAVHRIVQHNDKNGTSDGWAVEHDLQDNENMEAADLLASTDAATLASGKHNQQLTALVMEPA